MIGIGMRIPFDGGAQVRLTDEGDSAPAFAKAWVMAEQHNDLLQAENERLRARVRELELLISPREWVARLEAAGRCAICQEPATCIGQYESMERTRVRLRHLLWSWVRRRPLPTARHEGGRVSLDVKALYPPRAVVSELLKRSTEAERPVVENLAIAAGLLWRCANRRCGEVMHRAMDGSTEACPRCGRLR